MMNESNEKYLFTCTGFDFFVDRCESCDKKSGCEKREELLKGLKHQDKESEHFEPCFGCDAENRFKCEFCDLVVDDDLPF